jgi:hypothetical protein
MAGGLSTSAMSAVQAKPIWRRWREWVPYAMAGWSLAYGALGLYWAVGGRGFPFGAGNDPDAADSILFSMRAETGAPLIAALGLIGAIVGLALARGQWRGVVRWALLVFAWIMAAVLLFVVPDARVLQAVGYAPLFVVGAPFGWPPVSVREAIPWPVLNQLILIAGGVLWAATAAVASGVLDTRSHWTSPEAAARWGTWAVALAVIIPLFYTITRYAWALGIPLGISEEFLREGQASGLWMAGFGLGTVALIGAVLTLGLMQRWGEVFPRWVPGLAGKRVPPALAIVPATLAAIVVTSGGLTFMRLFLSGAAPEDGWATLGPGLLWPVWGAALGAATLAYVYRRRDERKCPPPRTRGGAS